jgi:hypothetical protein
VTGITSRAVGACGWQYARELGRDSRGGPGPPAATSEATKSGGRVRGGLERTGVVQPSAAEHGRGHLNRCHGAPVLASGSSSYARAAVRPQPTNGRESRMAGFLLVVEDVAE